MRLRRSLVTILVFAIGLAAGSFVSETMAGFSATTENSGNSFATASDWRPPTVTATAIGKTAGGITGYIKSGGTYYIYAQVVDQGNPASGISTVTANTSSFDAGITAAALTAGSYTANGVSYNYRSASLTADNPLVGGSYSYSITSTDGGARSQTQTGYTVTADILPPAGSDIQANNTSGGTAGRAEQGDTVVYTFTEQIEPISILAGWGGSSTNVVLKWINSGGNDKAQVWNAANTSQLPLGEINTQGDYVGADITFGASGTPSTMVQSGATITITLGTVSDATKIKTMSADTQLWTPSSTATDRAGNPCDISVVTELGVLDLDF